MQSFWNNDSDLQDIADQLVLMVPDMGPVEQPRKNKALERFRRASNCYYDLYIHTNGWTMFEHNDNDSYG